MAKHAVETLPCARETLEALRGKYRLVLITKVDLFDQERKIALSGLEWHRIMVPGGDPAECVEGMVFALTPEELAAADAYEVADYSRVEIALRSGGRCWAYVRAAA